MPVREELYRPPVRDPLRPAPELAPLLDDPSVGPLRVVILVLVVRPPSLVRRVVAVAPEKAKVPVPVHLDV